MPNYKKMYFRLFHAMTDAIELLQQAQIDTEEAYISSSEEEEETLVKIVKKEKES